MFCALTKIHKCKLYTKKRKFNSAKNSVLLMITVTRIAFCGKSLMKIFRHLSSLEEKFCSICEIMATIWSEF